LFAAIARDTRLPSAKRRQRRPVATAEAVSNSVIEYHARSDRSAARSLARLIKHVTLQRDPALAAGTIQLILGSTFTSLSPARATRSPGTADLARQYAGITGNVSICGDAAAFSGPDGDS
jgi:hypothetical protein